MLLQHGNNSFLDTHKFLPRLVVTSEGRCLSQFGFLDDSGFLTRLGRPVGRFNTELLCIFRVQPLPATELHGVGTDHAANGSPAEETVQNIETNVPSGSTHGDEAMTDVGPKRKARAIT